MPMTENELADLDKLLRRMEKNAKAWTYTRWLVVVLGLIFLGGVAWLMVKQPAFFPTLMPKDSNSPVTAFDGWSARDTAMVCCVVWTAWVFQLSLGGIMLTSSLCHWRKGQNDRLLVKMAQAWLESQSPVLPDTP